MTDLYIGCGVEEFGLSQLVECKVFERLHYAGTKEMLADVTGSEFANDREVVYLDNYGLSSLELSLARDAEEVISVTENGTELEFEEIKNEAGLVRSVKIASAKAKESRRRRQAKAKEQICASSCRCRSICSTISS